MSITICVSFERTGKALSDWELEKLGGAPGIGNRKLEAAENVEMARSEMIGKSQKPHP